MGLSVGNENALLAINRKGWYDFIYTITTSEKIL
jgi:hypothetical protein